MSTPVIAGGLFAVNRAWFVEIGTYDTGTAHIAQRELSIQRAYKQRARVP